ncbi:iron complex outermembrane receptor protein [Hoylesella shahii DSM 15611 = JCM 12083]|uniref:Iron complex outermembrane receptor protein n=2 Tax=Hoylesella shahii TaxID=228603 RepID=A0A318HZ19_9BACT|nr:iron complex outermembrane receptor protein [Hoylesella shahii DSM 15611 = JCM 12083]
MGCIGIIHLFFIRARTAFACSKPVIIHRLALFATSAMRLGIQANTYKRMIKTTILCIALAACTVSWANINSTKPIIPALKSEQADSTNTKNNKQNGKSKLNKEQNIGEIVVTGVRQQASINSVSNKIDESLIDRSMGKSLASILEHVSGVSSIQTGTTVAKPVINGMYGNRILIVNNGARQTGQQWGVDHAPEIDQNSSGSIEVIKGAESVRYGSEALGGIIVMNQKALPYGQTALSGHLRTLYGNNGKRYSVVAQAEGTMPFSKNLAWRLQGTYANSGDQSTAKYVLNNTGYREHDFSASLGYKLNALKLEGYYSMYNLKLGVLNSAQLGSEDLLKERIALGQPAEVYPYSRHINYPFQQIVHHTAIGKVYFDAGKYGNFFWQTAFQADDRQENRIRRMNLSYIPAVSMYLTSFQNQLKWNLAYNKWNTEAGATYLHIRNRNQTGTGVVPLIPNYTEYDLGIYAIQKYRNGNWTAETGIRFDNQETRASGYDYTGKLYGGHHVFSNFSYNLGTSYRFNEQLKLTSNLGLAWRAPHVHELYSNGNELGSGMFVMGDSTMHSEQSTKWVTSLSYRSAFAEVRVDAYLQWINGYIYDEPLKGRYVTVISGSYPLFQYKQTDAFFRGIDLDVRLKPMLHLEYHLLSGLIWANEKQTGNYLPYIPSARFDHDITWEDIRVGKGNAWLQLKHRLVLKQTRFNPANDLIDFTPPTYNLFGLEAGIDWPLGERNKLRMLLSADNLFNKEYKEYTNRSRYYAHDMGRDIRFSIGWFF